MLCSFVWCLFFDQKLCLMLGIRCFWDLEEIVEEYFVLVGYNNGYYITNYWARRLRVKKYKQVSWGREPIRKQHTINHAVIRQTIRMKERSSKHRAFRGAGYHPLLHTNISIHKKRGTESTLLPMAKASVPPCDHHLMPLSFTLTFSFFFL